MSSEAFKQFITKHNVVTLKADKTNKAPEVDTLLKELGNNATGIPFYAVFPAHGGEPITFGSGKIITAGQAVEAMEQAVQAGGDSSSESSSMVMR